jgi:hypothetical protein
MARIRIVGQQVRSGFCIAGAIVLVFVVICLLEISLAYATGRAGPRAAHRLLATVVVAGLMAFMFCTTRYWAKWLFAALAYALVRLAGGLLFGPHLSRPVSRGEFAVWLVYTGVAAALTARHIRRHPQGPQRVGLVAFARVPCLQLSMAHKSRCGRD